MIKEENNLERYRLSNLIDGDSRTATQAILKIVTPNAPKQFAEK